MKITGSRHPQDSLSAFLAPHFPIDPRRLTVFVALILAIIEKRTVSLYQLVSCIRLVGSDETIYQRLKRFVQFDWDKQQTMTARFALAHFQDQDELFLIMDRTNWKWGKQDINFLILSVMWKSFAFPLAWTVLPHGGSSSTVTRIEQEFPRMRGRSCQAAWRRSE